MALTIGAADLEEVLDRLLPLVPQGVHDEPPRDGRVELAVYGPSPSRAELEEAVGRALVEAGEGEVDDDPTRRHLEAHARREPIGGRIIVRPEGAPAPPEGLVDVVLGASGGAFGGGSHPTTAMCLELLLMLEPGGSLADLGCGTGVLAIAAAKLGWSPVFALDHEQIAVSATRANCRLNGVELEAHQADLLDIPPPPATVLAANVPPKVHERVAERLPADVQAVIASGVVEEHLEEAIVAYGRAGLVPVARLERRSWAAALLVRDA